jgi:hypothetical protein
MVLKCYERVALLLARVFESEIGISSFDKKFTRKESQKL